MRVLIATVDKGLRYTQYDGQLVVRAGHAEEDDHVLAASTPEHTAFKALRRLTLYRGALLATLAMV